MGTLSVVMPCFNEEVTVLDTAERVLASPRSKPARIDPGMLPRCHFREAAPRPSDRLVVGDGGLRARRR
jgi:hypothetical protein